MIRLIHLSGVKIAYHEKGNLNANGGIRFEMKYASIFVQIVENGFDVMLMVMMIITNSAYRSNITVPKGRENKNDMKESAAESKSKTKKKEKKIDWSSPFHVGHANFTCLFFMLKHLDEE